MSSQIVSSVSIGVGALVVCMGLALWLRSRREAARLSLQQAASKRMVLPPSVADVERYSGAKARLRVLERRSWIALAAVAVGIVGGAAGGWGFRRAPAPRVIAQPAEAPKFAAAPTPEVEQAKQLLVRLGKLCKSERRKCVRRKKDIGPIVASVCHFHPEVCADEAWPPGLSAPSAEDQAAAPRLPRPVLQRLTDKAAAGTLAWDDLQLALP